MIDILKAWLKGIARQRWMLGVAAVALAALFAMHGEQIGVWVLKTALVTWFAAIGYYADRAAFPYARPHDLMQVMYGATGTDKAVFERCFSAAQLRRAIIVAAAMLAGAMAL